MTLPIVAVVDTNWFIGALAKDERLPSLSVHSVVTRIELLSSPALGPDEIAEWGRFIAESEEVALNDDIVQESAALRRRFGGRLPDAVIAATAVVNGLPVLTRDRGMLRYAAVVVLPALV